MTTNLELLAVARDIVLQAGGGNYGAKHYADVIFPTLASARGLIAQAANVTAAEAVVIEIELQAWMDPRCLVTPALVRSLVAHDLRSQSAHFWIGRKYAVNVVDELDEAVAQTEAEAVAEAK